MRDESVYRSTTALRNVLIHEYFGGDPEAHLAYPEDIANAAAFFALPESG